METQPTWWQIMLMILAWIFALWWAMKFGRYRNRRAGDRKGKFKKWWGN